MDSSPNSIINQVFGDTSENTPIATLAQSIIEKAHSLQASDIHIEPFKNEVRIRFRIDGILHEYQTIPKTLQASLINYVKLLTASMSIAEKRLPQDGRAHTQVRTHRIHLRISTVPTIHGESIVIRVIDRSCLDLGLSDLGLVSDDRSALEYFINLPHGLILITGPTGSGKTTTLYSCLKSINTPNHKIITVEDPIEYQLPGINQVQVNSQIGMTFPVALRAILRQAPNIVTIGEIRDFETAQIAINASLTGHLIFSTLHTNDAVSAISRLIDLSIKPYLLASSIQAIIAQRLVRRLCTHCKQQGSLSNYQSQALRITNSAMVMKPLGCNLCNSKGFKGRTGLFEIFQINDAIRHAIASNQAAHKLHYLACQQGMRTLYNDGIEKMLSGLTTAEEVLGNCGGSKLHPEP